MPLLQKYATSWLGRPLPLLPALTNSVNHPAFSLMAAAPHHILIPKEESAPTRRRLASMLRSVAPLATPAANASTSTAG